MASFSFKALSLAAAITLSGSVAMSQVVISEVMINPSPGSDLGQEWIEVTNVSNSPVSMAEWCLFVSTRKELGSTEPGTYYWPFPDTGPGSLLSPGGRILVRWMQNGTNQPQTSPAHFEVFTGTTVHDFLFGLFHYDTTVTPTYSDMELPDLGGAIGLIRTRDANNVLLPGYWADYLEYGDTGFLCPQTTGVPPVIMPVQAGIWTAGEYVAIPSGHSEWPLSVTLAYAYTGNSKLNYWLDTSPTPGDWNTTGSISSSYGQGCSCTGSGPSLLLSLPVPAVIGSREFLLLLSDGIPNSPAIVFLSTGVSPVPQNLLGCDLNLVNLLVSLPPFTTDANGTGMRWLPLPVNPALVGLSVAAQGFVASPQTFNGLYCGSNAVTFSVGQ